MTPTSAELLERFQSDRAGDINLTLRPVYMDLLAKLGNPHLRLPPVFHVAGTNGKGSVCAFLRAILEAQGYRVHVYTSPHLVHFHERIRVAGALIGEEELAEILTTCLRHAAPGEITLFEAATAAAFTAFARHPADFTILEVGLGGRLDATNVIEKPVADIITRISNDHREYLGSTLARIAGEKAGIMRAHIPCFAAAQPSIEVRAALRAAAAAIRAPFFTGGEDWTVEARAQGFRYQDAKRRFDLPAPALTGAHQFENAALAIAALSVLREPVPQAAIVRGLRTVEWPARMQKLDPGALPVPVPEGWDVWLDGGHNDSAGAVLAEQARAWRTQDGAAARPLHVIVGMLKTKLPQEFLAPLAPYADGLQAVAIPDAAGSFPAQELADMARSSGIKNAAAAAGIAAALKQIAGTAAAPDGRILICGSLYLAGYILRHPE